MAKKSSKCYATPADCAPEVASAVLKKQPRYGDENWQPNEIPTRGSLRPVYGPLVDRPKSAYNERMGIERPTNRGRGKPRDGEF